MITVYTDGSCHPNPNGTGGWAYVILINQNNIIINKGQVKKTTNNRMELQAVIEALNEAKNHLGHSYIEIKTDSQLITKYNSKGRGKKNLDLVKQIVELNQFFKDKKIEVTYTWIKGHSNIQYNELANDLANLARLNQENEMLMNRFKKNKSAS